VRARAFDRLFTGRRVRPERGVAPARAGTTAPAEAAPKTFSNAQMAEALWRAGHLEYLLRPYQRLVYRSIKRELWATGYLKPSPRNRRFILEICRRWGKSTLCALVAFELCIQKPGAKVYWAAETSKQVRKILRNVLRPLLYRCPKDMRPKWNSQDSFYAWPNGSEIHIGGCEDESKADRLRGDGCDLFIIDEAGSIDILDYVYRNLAVFMALDRNGRVFMPSTPARSPGHAFTTYCVQAEMGDGGYARQDIYSANFTERQIEELAEDLGGKDTDDWKREALVQRVIDLLRAICPEFSEAGTEDNSSKLCAHSDGSGRRCGVHRDEHEGRDHDFRFENTEEAICMPYCVHVDDTGEVCGVHHDKHGEQIPHDFEWQIERPPHAACYAGLDWGQGDPTAAAFAYHDFKRALLVYEGEFELTKVPTTIEIAAAITDTESELWSEHFARQTHDVDAQKPHTRVGDTALQILRDLDALHGIYVSPARKDDRDANINDFRVRVKQRRMRIHPRCRKLRAQLKAGIWNKKRSTYERLNGLGHCDIFDAARYLARHVDEQFDPYPPKASHLDGWRRPGERPRPTVPGHHRDLAEQWGAMQDALFPDMGESDE
jgi:hypothetical protein